MPIPERSTSYSRWARSLTIDSIFLGVFGYAFYYSQTTMAETTVFVLSWLVGISIVVMLITLNGYADSVQNIREFADIAGKGSPTYKREIAKFIRAWPIDHVLRLNHSLTYLWYHFLTDVALVYMLTWNGHWILSSMLIVKFLLSMAHVACARNILEHGYDAPDKSDD